jgi:hypothetical protein
MPNFRIHFRNRATIEPDEIGLEVRDLHHAYLEAVKAIPETARDLLIHGQDPMRCAFVICDAKGAQLMEVPFSELLSPAEWRTARTARKPHGGGRSDRVRDDLALSSFRRMFSALDVGCVLMTPELEIRDINAFGARHSQVERDAVIGRSILDAFDLSGQPFEDFTRSMQLAQRGVTARLIDMPYLVLDEAGATCNGWWNVRVWPIFDDDGHLLGLVDWSEPSTRPTAGGRTVVRVGRGLPA